VTTKYSRRTLCRDKERARGEEAGGARGALILKAISKEWSRTRRGAGAGFSEVIVVTTAIPPG